MAVTARAEDVDPTAPCVHCGEVIEREDYDELYRRYDRHVKDVHDKPATVLPRGGP